MTLNLKVGTALSMTAMVVAAAENEPPRFPEGYENGVHYAIVERDGIREELFTSAAAIEAVNKGLAIPDGQSSRCRISVMASCTSAIALT